MEKRFVYIDNAATTMVRPQAADILCELTAGGYANASSLYSIGRESALRLKAARKTIAQLLGARSEREVYFTSGGTESINMAIRGAAKSAGKGHIITTKIEHPAVLNTIRELEKSGFEATYLDVGQNGVVNVKSVYDSVRDDTILISVMYVNNEIGTIQPIAEIAKLAKERGIVFHTDAVQAAGHIKIDVSDINVDMVSISAHKFGGPKGAGALYLRQGVSLEPFITGGEQEFKKRAGTENVAAAAAMAKALELACENIDSESVRQAGMRDRLTDGILSAVPHSRLNGDRVQRICSNINISFEGIDSESLVLMLDMHGICASGGSACMAGQGQPSHVLQALGLSEDLAKGALRLSLGENNSDSDVDYILKVLPEAVQKLRRLSPIWSDRQ